jgi:hypothetical protein
VASIESDVLTEFEKQLASADEVPGAVVERLCALLGQEKLPKAEELITPYSAESGDRLA